MQTLSLTAIKARFSEVIAQVQEGDEVIVMHRGIPVVRISVLSSHKNPLPLEELKAFRNSIPKVKTPSHVLLRQLRDKDY